MVWFCLATFRNCSLNLKKFSPGFPANVGHFIFSDFLKSLFFFLLSYPPPPSPLLSPPFQPLSISLLSPSLNLSSLSFLFSLSKSFHHLQSLQTSLIYTLFKSLQTSPLYQPSPLSPNLPPFSTLRYSIFPNLFS